MGVRSGQFRPCAHTVERAYRSTGGAAACSPRPRGLSALRVIDRNAAVRRVTVHPGDLTALLLVPWLEVGIIVSTPE